MEIQGLKSWGGHYKRPLVMAGPCSAETFDQLHETTKAICNLGVNIIRAGVWKPRTRPNQFEGIGLSALKWIRDIKAEFNVEFAVEVANPQHVAESLYHGVDILWIGARSTVNPFTVQEIANSLRGVDIPVFVKNPINPDLSLWIGAIGHVGVEEAPVAGLFAPAPVKVAAHGSVVVEPVRVILIGRLAAQLHAVGKDGQDVIHGEDLEKKLERNKRINKRSLRAWVGLVNLMKIK